MISPKCALLKYKAFNWRTDTRLMSAHVTKKKDSQAHRDKNNHACPFHMNESHQLI